MIVNVSVVHLHNHMADQELWLIAAAHHHGGVLYHILLAQEKIKIQNIVSTECLSLSHYHKVEKS